MAGRRPDSARSVVPSGHLQPDPTDQGVASSEFLTQRDELVGGRPGHHAPSTPPLAELLGFRLRRIESPRDVELGLSAWLGLVVRTDVIIDVPVPA
jgi:hypothetical protein